MKATFVLALCVLSFLVSACTQKVNDPADVQAIRDTSTAWDKALSDRNAKALASIFTPDAITLEPNQPALVGKDAIHSSLQKFLDQYTSEGRSVVEDVRVCGDLAVARATYESKSTLKAGGYSVSDKGSWVAAYQRQPDGSWKIFWDIANSSLPVAKILPVGEEEQALMQIERDWVAALVKNDVAAIDKILAPEFLQSSNEAIPANKRQYLAALKSDATKIESWVLSDMKALVLGDRAIVDGISTIKSSLAGKDTSGQGRWTEVWVKRDGRWQCVMGYATKGN